MQIDGHHALTYVAARLAGFVDREAQTIAYASQYVDDATNRGVIQFEHSKFMYYRITSAHDIIDYDNFVDVENNLAWLPFHFLPGCGGLPAGQFQASSESDLLCCSPDSYVARDMLRLALKDRNHQRALHRLGISMHVYADTFAHQGFVGSQSVLNRASDVHSDDPVMDQRILAATQQDLFVDLWNKGLTILSITWRALLLLLIKRKSPRAFISNFLNTEPLGHIRVDAYPDLPYLRWRYKDWQGNVIERDNPSIYKYAVDMMIRAMRAWRANDETMALEQYPGLPEQDEKTLSRLIESLQEPNAKIRHQAWLNAIAEGQFSFGAATIGYAQQGEDSWRAKALGVVKNKDARLEVYAYKQAFLSSDWKLFHDALQVHRSNIVHDILPQYGVCAA
jgi:hypothetical protein